jgi:hypothetical protein
MFPDQFSFKFRKPAEHGQHQSAVRRRCIRPSVFQRPEARTSLP